MSAISFGSSDGVSVDLVRMSWLLPIVGMLLVLALPVVTLARRVNVFSWRFNTIGLSITLTSLTDAVSIVFVFTSFGPDCADVIEVTLVSDAFLTELVRDTGLRSGSFFQCVSTRGFTFFKSMPPVEFTFSLLLLWFGTFLSLILRGLSVRLTKLPRAGRRVVVVDVVVTFFIPPNTASPWVIKFYVIQMRYNKNIKMGIWMYRNIWNIAMILDIQRLEQSSKKNDYNKMILIDNFCNKNERNSV